MGMLAPMRRRELAPWFGLRDFDDYVNRVFSNFPLEPEASSAWMPDVDVRETDDAYVLEADLPGMTKKDVDVSVVDDVVTLKGERKEESEKKENGYRRVERSYGSFQRSFRIPGGIDAAKVQAKYADGVLTVTLPKRADAKPKQVAVEIK